MKRWAFRKAGWNQYGQSCLLSYKFHILQTFPLIFHYFSGLYRDDILYETPDVKEAIRRLPEKVIDERNFRSIRAAQLSIQKITLPQKDWVSYEEDRANRYLEPYIEQVKKEREEKEKWISTH